MLLLTAIILLAASASALFLVWPNHIQYGSQAMGIFATLLGMVCGLTLLGWWLAIFSGKVTVPRRRYAVYSLQFSVSFLLIMIYAVARAIGAPTNAGQVEQTVGEYLLILSLFAVAHWVTSVASFLLHTRRTVQKMDVISGVNPPKH
jgi:hypothetical protein